MSARDEPGVWNRPADSVKFNQSCGKCVVCSQIVDVSLGLDLMWGTAS